MSPINNSLVQAELSIYSPAGDWPAWGYWSSDWGEESSPFPNTVYLPSVWTDDKTFVVNSEELRCKYCRVKFDAHEKFCAGCGAPL